MVVVVLVVAVDAVDECHVVSVLTFASAVIVAMSSMEAGDCSRDDTCDDIAWSCRTSGSGYGHLIPVTTEQGLGDPGLVLLKQPVIYPSNFSQKFLQVKTRRHLGLLWRLRACSGVRRAVSRCHCQYDNDDRVIVRIALIPYLQ